jgi:ribonuclease-3 family protein
LLSLGYEKVKDLHHIATEYVRASTQAMLLHTIIPQLTETENQIVHRGRNAKGGHPKSTDVVTYRHATAFESLVGYWQMTGNTERMQWAFEQIDELLEAKRNQANHEQENLDEPVLQREQ